MAALRAAPLPLKPRPPPFLRGRHRPRASPGSQGTGGGRGRPPPCVRGAVAPPVPLLREQLHPDALLGPADVRELAAALGVRPTKQRGQNFVIDANTVRRIVRTADVRPEDVVVEVGPGLGSLTLALLEVAERVTAVEIDDVLAGAARDHRRADARARGAVRTGALRRPARHRAAGPAPTALVANLPYNVAVPVLLHMLDTFPSIERTLVMVQSEVADRLAPPGSKVYGVPSVKANWYADVKRAGAIGRNVFWPAPNVDSGSSRWSGGPSRSRPRRRRRRCSPSWTPPSPSGARRCGPRSPAGRGRPSGPRPRSSPPGSRRRPAGSR
ncbi:16S rRNA (adenine(1518)-N(6)/adenine(1519)-N(6))-dimethyltransferase RsmA [Streptomyces sp. T1317-0309]|nr:16S rRNA (adenine(1518)-N(6)/adenine(1519)-N(6))-dimethyltransferase RsmA [Streptomyces sp. T1317-0309]